MNDNIILTIRSKNDIDKISTNTKYINIDIKSVDINCIDYFFNNGMHYMYSECINKKNGYIYVDYNTFFKGQIIVNDIMNRMDNLSKLELAKYLYISIGKIIGNVIEEDIDINNNIWSALVNKKATNQSFCKLYLYLCSLMNINCDIITNDNNYLCNKLEIDDEILVVDLTNDTPFIQANFKTRYFSNYNDSLELDRNINYIDYNDIKIDKLNKEKDIFKFLKSTEEILDIKRIKSLELGKIYEYLFKKYFSSLDITINNLLINNKDKNNFIVINCIDKNYTYNYNKSTFVEIDSNYLVENLNNNIISFVE